MKKLVVFVAALALFASSAYAAEWNFYGSARVATFYKDTDTIGGANVSKTLSHALQGNARIGAKVKVSDELAGRFEYGASNGNANIRLLYGEWNFGAGKLLVGQDYSPAEIAYSSQVIDADNGLLAQGSMYSGRAGQVKLTFGGFQIAAVQPSTNVLNTVGYTAEVDLPCIEANYTFDINNFSLKVAGGYNSYELKNAANTLDVDSYVIGIGGKVNFGAGFLAGTIIGGTNIGAIVAVDVDGDNAWGDGLATTNGTQVVDNDAFGYSLVGGYTFNDMFKIEAGYGFIETELDNATTSDEESSYYLQATVTLAPGVFFVPEIGKIDGEEAGDSDVTYYGIKWQINF